MGIGCSSADMMGPVKEVVKAVVAWERVMSAIKLRISSSVSPSGETEERAWTFLRGGEANEMAFES